MLLLRKTTGYLGVRSDSRIWEDGEYTPLPSPDAGAFTGAPHATVMRQAHACCFAIQPLHAVVRRRVRRRFWPTHLVRVIAQPAIMLPAKSRASGGKDVSRSLQ